jgi:hypothetical protein
VQININTDFTICMLLQVATCVLSFSASPALLYTMQTLLTRSFKTLATMRTQHHLESVMRSVCDQASSILLLASVFFAFCL